MRLVWLKVICTIVLLTIRSVGKWVPAKMHEIESAAYHDGINTLVSSNFCTYEMAN